MGLFLSRSNPLVLAYKMSKEVEKIGKNLSSFADKISSVMEFSHEPIKNRNRETCSYVDVVDIVGREADLEHIVGMLLDYDVQNDVSFLPIVGMGGLGKTALAQLVYNDKRVESAFSLRLWHCVSDQDQKQLNIADILRKILTLVTDENHEKSSEQIVQSQVQNKLSSEKYLLVLDDVWTENCNQWNDLVRLLKGGQRGSWIVVTTRSEVTAKFIGCGSMYKLQGLAKKESWSLFEKIAFGSEHSDLHDDLVQIGQNIVEACAGVPLALRVAGSLVYGQDKKKWERVQEVGVANMGNDIIKILKLSYHHLQFSLKNCFSYCAIFPKDYRMQKNMLISLWMAHNYIVPLYEGQSIEDAGEEHFLILLRRCFFQDIEKDDETGEISIKIHDLMHDIAQSVSRQEIYVANTISGNLDKKIRHVSTLSTTNFEKYTSGNSHIRSYLNIFEYNHESRGVDRSFLEKLVESCKYLRALTLTTLGDKCLPSSIGKLLHLRYLDLSHLDAIVVLPNSITKLYNLETLNLSGCQNLKDLPKDFSSLVKLRVLNISNCISLKHMPMGIGKLTSIRSLSNFVVRGEDSCLSWNEWFFGLDDLEALKNLEGYLKIEIKWPEKNKIFSQNSGKRNGMYLTNKEHLNYIDFYFDVGEYYSKLDDEETLKLMEDLEPPSNLQFLKMFFYHGNKMPNWISHLPNLVSLTVFSCLELEYLKAFGNVEEGLILPSLEKLELDYLPMLKDWKRGDLGTEASNYSQLQLPLYLPRLKHLIIKNCWRLSSFPLCPSIEILDLQGVDQRFTGIIERERNDDLGDVKKSEFPKLREVKIKKLVAWLNSLPIESFQCLKSLHIRHGRNVKNLREFEKVFYACSSSLQFLCIENFPILKSIVRGGLEHLSALEKLEIMFCDDLNLSEEKEEEDGSGIDMAIMTHKSLLPSLRYLKLHFLCKMVNLPNWMQFLPALQVLAIQRCRKLKSMPNWMPKLVSLKQLYFSNCLKSLERRCKEDPAGEDWPYIQHIPNIEFRGSFGGN
ncbi:disease resistance protein RGA2-like [Amaranthus tricolor]|uniref:disease resistance protein RGA2-like n=1 Tax=Amaranthus tricolor TaxID=29722 RepID=UPI002588BECA|nr:disease resistance protein RGA2-like [Amaranthus tricolor]